MAHRAQQGLRPDIVGIAGRLHVQPLSVARSISALSFLEKLVSTNVRERSHPTDDYSPPDSKVVGVHGHASY